MTNALLIILFCQLVGEAIAASSGIPVPGPVLGMLLLLIIFLVHERAVSIVRPTAQTLLAHLSLLFVPAGVGIVGHLSDLGADAVVLLLAIVVSTVLAIVSAAWVFVAVTRLTGDGHE